MLNSKQKNKSAYWSRTRNDFAIQLEHGSLCSSSTAKLHKAVSSRMSENTAITRPVAIYL